MQAIDLIIAGNLYPETKEEEMIDLSKYIKEEKERVYVHNAMTIAKACINESIGEPNNGEILDETEWSKVNKFSREYIDSIDQLLNYEYYTLDESSFLNCSANTRCVITSIFQSINASLPTQPYYITLRSSAKDENGMKMYYRYFYDDVNGIAYYPEEGKNATIQYREYWKDANNETQVGEVYTEDEMFVMAGSPLQIDDRKTYNTDEDKNVKEYGIQNKVDSAYNLAIEDFNSMRKSYIKSR